jgi:TrmH family RNA methyltransferase
VQSGAPSKLCLGGRISTLGLTTLHRRCVPLRQTYNRLLLTPQQRDRLEVVLVSPRNPLNIGAAARAMANFGFTRLAVVAPYEPHWREARSAVGAPGVLENARQTATLAEAVADCAFVAGTGTLTYRQPDQPALLLPDAASFLAARMADHARAALVFGPEKHGLTRDDLSYCHALIEIPTDPRQPSMNLGQAVAVCLYELARPEELNLNGTLTTGLLPSRQKKDARMRHGGDEVEPASKSADLDRLAGLIEEAMIAAGYSPRAMQPANRHDLRVLLRRLAPTALDTRRMMGLFRRILHRLQHPPGSPQ